jgi:hypothetical protein
MTEVPFLATNAGWATMCCILVGVNIAVQIIAAVAPKAKVARWWCVIDAILLSVAHGSTIHLIVYAQVSEHRIGDAWETIMVMAFTYQFGLYWIMALCILKGSCSDELIPYDTEGFERKIDSTLSDPPIVEVLAAASHLESRRVWVVTSTDSEGHETSRTEYSPWRPLSPETGHEPGVASFAPTEYTPVVTHAKKERYEYQSWQAAGQRPAWPKADAVSVTFDATAVLDDAAKAATEAMGERLRGDLIDQDLETHAGAVVTYGDFESEVKGALDDCAVKRHNFMVGGFGALLMVLLTLCGQHVLYEGLANIRVTIEKTISGTGGPRARPHERDGGGQPEPAAEPELLQAATRMVLQVFRHGLIVDPNSAVLSQNEVDSDNTMGVTQVVPMQGSD